ncbi:MAG: aminodeoxychorismate synthase component I, partial [Ignavibacteriaceae bacterium]|nr:aminodeoxychorismate synthase component I [Ignavibacteria bacterium]NNL20314.1 aminodeoxychorismate synthase component I [Ignavibacteriaceae bacterium]
NPVEIISVTRKEDLPLAQRFLDKHFNKGMCGYCLIDYEAGYLLEPKLEPLIEGNSEKLIQIFFFDKKDIQKVKSSKIDFDLKDNDGYAISDFKLNTSEKKYFRDIRKIKRYLKAGDSYQVNYTVKAKFKFNGSYSSFYKKLLFNQSARYSAFINNNESIMISLSPELFFKLYDGRIYSKPMKGTIKRGIEEKEDLLKKSELATGEKNKAENVMIVDLIRNDFGKVCKYGSIKAPDLFKTEKYESLFQLISTVYGKLKKNRSLSDVISSMFPCGSVTGAPKIRTMEIIKEIEKERRGFYTGGIGLMMDEDATFNVAIRTLKINSKTNNAEIGIGSGIVWDSIPEEEWKETLLKSNFLKHPTKYFRIIETMLFDSGKILFFEEHIERLKSTANFFLFNFKEQRLSKRITKSILQLDENKKYVLRVMLGKWGEISMETKEFIQTKNINSIILSQHRISSQNKFQYFKTTNRDLYESEYKKYSANNVFDVLFLNEKGELAEGSISNIFVKRQGVWFTPTINSGIIAGIYRNYLLKTQPDIIETSLTTKDLSTAEEVKMVNSVRGEVNIDRIYFDNNEFIEINPLHLDS